MNPQKSPLPEIFGKGALGKWVMKRCLLSSGFGIVAVNFDVDLEGCGDFRVKLDLEVLLAGCLDGAVELDGVTVDLNTFFNELLVDIDGGDGSEGFASLSGFQCEGEFEFFDLTCKVLCLLEFIGFAFDTLGSKGLKMLKVCFVCLEGFAFGD